MADKPVVGVELAEVFLKHGALIRRALSRVGVESENLDDAIQDVFVVILRRFVAILGSADDHASKNVLTMSQAVGGLEVFLRGLSPTQCEVFILSSVHGRTQSQIADQLGTQLQRVQAQLHQVQVQQDRATARLRTRAHE